MAGKDISVKKYVVRLNAGEREHLQALIRKGKSPAKAAVEGAHSVEGRCLGGRRRLERQLDRPGLSMIYRVRKQLVEEGFDGPPHHRRLRSRLERSGRSPLPARQDHRAGPGQSQHP